MQTTHKNKLKISVCIPTYHGTDYLKDCLDSVLKQSFTDFEVLINNDSMDDFDKVKKLVDSYKDKRIKLSQNKQNMGYPLNMRKTTNMAQNEILFLMAQDDVILDKDTFKKCVKIFEKNPKVGVITRPYYWFEDDVNKPIRFVPKFDKRIIDARDGEKPLRAILETVGQFSGLVLRKSLITHPFNEGVFPAHIYPFLSVMKTHKAYFWEDFMIAVRTSSSQTRFLSSIYNPSPTKTWVQMFLDIFPEKKFKSVREIGIKHITLNYMGLVQIKNYGYYKDLLVDIYYMIKYRPKNLLNLKFWFFVIGVLVTPRFILRKMVDYYKNVFNKKRYNKLL